MRQSGSEGELDVRVGGVVVDAAHVGSLTELCSLVSGTQ